MDSPHMKSKLMVSLAIKICNDTSETNGLLQSLLVFAVTPKLPINRKNLPSQSERTQVMKVGREEMSRKIATEKIKITLNWNDSSAANT